jgi:hypothetical protein
MDGEIKVQLEMKKGIRMVNRENEKGGFQLQIWSVHTSHDVRDCNSTISFQPFFCFFNYRAGSATPAISNK